MCLSRNVTWVHIAPCCGTASRARDIQPGPPPLRSVACPWRLPNLPEDLKGRVQSANVIYQHVADFLVWAASHVPSMRWSVENPQHSYFWLLPPVSAIWARQVQINFSSCRHGGSRNKATTFLCNNAALSSMCGGCPGNHLHLAWSRDSSGYDTAKEAEYPELLCQRFADCMASVTDLLRGPSQATEQARAGNQRQPRMSRMPPVVSEFAYTQRVSSAEEPPLDNRRLTSTWLNVPKGSKLLRSGLSEAGVPFLIFGIYRSPSQFLSDALLVERPFHAASALPDDMLRAVFLTLTECPLATMKHRLKTIQRWREMATCLEVEEAALRATMDPIVSSVLNEGQEASPAARDWQRTWMAR